MKVNISYELDTETDALDLDDLLQVQRYKRAIHLADNLLQQLITDNVAVGPQTFEIIRQQMLGILNDHKIMPNKD